MICLLDKNIIITFAHDKIEERMTAHQHILNATIIIRLRRTVEVVRCM